LEKLPGLRMVLEEAMRLHPPVWFTTRRATADVEVGGYHVPARTVVLLSPHTTHRHPDFWQNAGEFDPGRFSAERGKGRHRFSFFPFAGGKHQCLGQGLSMLEGQIILALLLQRYRVHAVPGHPVVPLAEITLRLRHGLMVTMEKRPAHG
jgi:cytochrome P450